MRRLAAFALVTGSLAAILGGVTLFAVGATLGSAAEKLKRTP